VVALRLYADAAEIRFEQPYGGFYIGYAKVDMIEFQCLMDSERAKKQLCRAPCCFRHLGFSLPVAAGQKTRQRRNQQERKIVAFYWSLIAKFRIPSLRQCFSKS